MDLEQLSPEQLRQEYRALRSRMQHYEIILAQTENVLFEWDYRADTISVSDAWKTIFGLEPFVGGINSKLVEGKIFLQEDIPVLLDCINALEGGSHYEQAEVRVVTGWGSYLWCRIRASAVRFPDGSLEKVLGIIINIDEEKRQAQMLHERADRDPLTKLLNKSAARKRTEDYLRRYQEGADCALMIIDLDNFKQVNDRMGHLYGDAVLTRAAREIERLFRPQDILARIGGDEFMVVVRGLSDRCLIEERCARLRDSLAAAFPELTEFLSCSIGVALAPVHGKAYAELFQKADQALYRAKAGGKNAWVLYSPELAREHYRVTMVSGRIDSNEQPELTMDKIFQYAFQQLYASRDVDASIGELLALIGEKSGVSRVYVFENSQDNRFCSNTYEWCGPGIQPEIDNLQNISYETDIPNYEENFDEEGIFYCPDVRVQPKNIRDIVEPQGICSMLHCAIREEGVFRGYIGFDDCRDYRLWTREQIRLLKDFSAMLSVFLLRQRSQERIRRQSEELYSVLDSRNAWIYILDPDSFRIAYRNKKVLRDTGAQPGMLCYQALMGRDTPCPGCPAREIQKRRHGQALLRSPQVSGPVLAEAGMIRWGGEDCCLMTCREIPEQSKL